MWKCEISNYLYVLPNITDILILCAWDVVRDWTLAMFPQYEEMNLIMFTKDFLNITFYFNIQYLQKAV